MNEKPTVLFVDDDKRIQRGWRRALADEPYAMVFAQSGQEALEVLKQVRASVLVTDYAMARGDGLFLLRQVRDRMPWMRSILVSGNATLAVAQQALNDLGIVKLFEKPCNPLDLGLAIRQELSSALEASAPESESARLLDLEREYPGISRVERDEHGAIVLTGDADR